VLFLCDIPDHPEALAAIPQQEFASLQLDLGQDTRPGFQL
jgi:hypothetical protein